MNSFFAAFFLLCCTPAVFGQNQHKLTITHLAAEFYVFTTYSDYQGTPYPANGMYVVADEGVILIDSPWDTTQYQPLLDSIRARHNKDVVMCIATHFHEDRTGGLQYFRNHGIATYTTRKTDELSTVRGMKRAQILIEKDTVFSIGKHTFETFYPGHGHTPDNIVVWFPEERVLYGGCLVKSARDSSLGNLGDANVSEYANTLRKVKKRFGKPAYIIPGHNDWTDATSLDHTLRMAEQARNKQKR